MRILVGVLHAIENEFEECIIAIQNQTYRNFEILLIENLPLVEACERLYENFMIRSYEFDLLIKVDADMVIENNELFSKIVKKFEEDKGVDHLEIAVQDFFSDQFIWSMNVYRDTVRWGKSSENLFADDDSIIPFSQVQHDDRELAPAASHCKNPSTFQSFHFGVQNMLKVIQPHLTVKRHDYAEYYWNIAERTWQNFVKRQDKRLGFAVLGGEIALRENFLPEHMSYFNPYLKEFFRKYENYSDKQLLNEIRQLRRKNGDILPTSIRRRWLCYLKK